MRSALVPSNIAHDEALEVRDAVPTTLVRWDWAYRTEFPKRCRDPMWGQKCRIVVTPNQINRYSRRHRTPCRRLGL